MQNSRGKRGQSASSVRQFLPALAALTGALHANVARADWGENWGEMTWGFAAMPVPMLDTWGLLLLPAVLAAAALLVITKRRAARITLVMFIALALPLAAYAATIAMPNDFVNGTVADAEEVDENFNVLVTESNAQDARISSLEASVVHSHPGSDIISQVADADTVDGVEASVLEESAEIDADITVHAVVASAHHTRYTDAEAFAAAAGVDAGTLDGLDSTDFAAASHAHSYGNVAIVAQSGGDYTDPKAAMDNLGSWCGTPGAANPCLLRIMPGEYALGNNAFTMQPYVDVEGSGENTTTIASTHSSNSSTEDSATVVGANNAEIRFLTVENLGGDYYSYALYNGSASPMITNVTVTASGGTYNYGVLNTASSSPTMMNVTATASGGTRAYGVNNFSSSPTMTNVTATASGGTEHFGVNNSSSATTMTNVTAEASGGTYNYGVFNTASFSPTMTNVTAEASGGTYNYGVNNFFSSPTMTNCTISGTTNSISNDSSTAKVATTMLDGSVDGSGYTCFQVYDASFSPVTCP